MSSKDSRPEAESFSAAATEAKDSIVGGAQYVKDRVTAPASGDRRADQDAKNVASDKAEEAKEHGKGVFESISDGAKYVGSRFTASPSGTEQAKRDAEHKKEEAGGLFARAGDKAQDAKDRTADKLKEEKEKAKDSYEDTQDTIADKIATNPVEEARAQGQIPADSATVAAARK